MDQQANTDPLAPVAELVYGYFCEGKHFDDGQPSELALIQAALQLHESETRQIQSQERRALELERAWQSCVQSLEPSRLYDFLELVVPWQRQRDDSALPTRLELKVSTDDSLARINAWLSLWRRGAGEAKHQEARAWLLAHLQEITITGVRREPNEEPEEEPEEEPHEEPAEEVKAEPAERLVLLPVSFLQHLRSASRLILQHVRLVRDCVGTVSLYAPYCTRLYWRNVRLEDNGWGLNLGAEEPGKRLRHSVTLQEVRVNNIYLGHFAAETRATLTDVQAADIDALLIQTLEAKGCDFHDVKLLLRHTEHYHPKKVSLDNCRLTGVLEMNAPDRKGVLKIAHCQVRTITLAMLLGRTYISDCPDLSLLRLERTGTGLLAQRVELSVVNCTRLESLWVPEFRGHLYLRGCDRLRGVRTGPPTGGNPHRGLPDDDADLENQLSAVWHVTDSAGSLALLGGPYRGGHSPVLLEIGADAGVEIPLQRCVLDVSGFLWVSVGPHTSRIIRWEPQPLRLERYALNNDARRAILAPPSHVHEVNGADSRQEWPLSGRHALEIWWADCARLLQSHQALQRQFKTAAFCLETLLDNLPGSGARVVQRLRAEKGFGRQVLPVRPEPKLLPAELVGAYAERLWQTLQELRRIPDQVAAYAISVLDREWQSERKEAKDDSARLAQVVKCLRPGDDDVYAWLGRRLGNCLGSDTSLGGLPGTMSAAVDELCLAAFAPASDKRRQQTLHLLRAEINRFCQKPHSVRQLLCDGRALLRRLSRQDFPVPPELQAWTAVDGPPAAPPEVRYLLQHVLFRLRDTQGARTTRLAAAAWLNRCKAPDVPWPQPDEVSDEAGDIPGIAVAGFLSACQRKNLRRAVRTPAPVIEQAIEPAIVPAEAGFDSPPPHPPAPQRAPPRPTKARR